MVDPNGMEAIRVTVSESIKSFQAAAGQQAIEGGVSEQKVAEARLTTQERSLPGDVRTILSEERKKGVKATVVDRIAAQKQAEFKRAATAAYEKWREANPLSDSTNPRSPNYSLFTPSAPQSGAENMWLVRQGFSQAHPPGDATDMLAAGSDFLIPTPGAASAINETAAALKAGLMDLATLGIGAGGIGSFGVGRTLARGTRWFPFGFKSSREFKEFGDAARAGLKDAGHADAVPIMQGSAVTGRSFHTGARFDVGRKSDFDVALSSGSLLEKARAAGVELRGGGVRTGPLERADLKALGLLELQRKLTRLAGRPVNFMIYQDVQAATGRAPSRFFPN
jgi:hypothetical protein